jgi:hypothetical protein
MGQFKIADNEVSGWVLSAASGDTFCTYPKELLYANAPGSIDGGAVIYDSLGLKQVAYQTLTGPGSAVYTSYTMDFGTDQKALAMFRELQSRNADRIGVAPFDTSMAFSKSVYSGLQAYAHFNEFFMQITLLGLANDSASLSAAGAFLTILKSKIK